MDISVCSALDYTQGFCRIAAFWGFDESASQAFASPEVRAAPVFLIRTVLTSASPQEYERTAKVKPSSAALLKSPFEISTFSQSRKNAANRILPRRLKQIGTKTTAFHRKNYLFKLESIFLR